jgi:hypothetical protein
MVSLPYLLVNGTLADADQVMADFNALNQGIEGLAENITRAGIPAVTVKAASFFTTGYATIGDRGSGGQYVPGAATPAYRKPIQDFSGAYWYLANGPFIYTNAGHYGLVGDGATDNHAAIQAAIDHTAAQGGGGTIVFPIGAFVIKTGLTVSTGMRFVGAGNGIGPGGTVVGGTQIISDITFKTGDMITCTTNQAVEFHSIGFNGLGGPFARTAGAAIKISGVLSSGTINVSSIVRDCAFSNQFQCIRLAECAVSVIECNTFIEWGHSAVYAADDYSIEANGGRISNNYFFGQVDAATTALTCILLECGYTTITNNLILGCQFGIAYIPSLSSTDAAAILIANNFIEEQAIKGIVFIENVSVTAELTGVVITGNEFSNFTNVSAFQSHISVLAGAAVWIANIVISHNTFRSGLTHAGGAYISIQSGDNVVISENVINMNNQDGAGGIVIGSQPTGHIFVCNNLFALKGAVALYDCGSNVRIVDLNLQLAVADLGSWANGSQCYVSDGQATSGVDQILIGSGSGCTANRARGQWLAPYGLTG